MEENIEDFIRSEMGDSFFDEVDSVADNETLKQLNDLVKQRATLLLDKEGLEAQLKVINEQLLDIETRQIPDAMDAAGIADFTTRDGFKIGVKPFVSTIPHNFKDQAFEWFDNNGLGSVIKRTVSLKFDKRQSEQASLAMERLQDMGFDPEQKLDIPYQTFQATVKELHEKGIMPPLHEWGVYFGRRATVKKK
jgi:hypothetical protein